MEILEDLVCFLVRVFERVCGQNMIFSKPAKG